MTIQIKGKTFRLLYRQADLERRAVEIAREIDAFFENQPPPLLAPVLAGGFRFAADLTRSLNTAYELAFVQTASYAGMESQNQVRLKLDIDRSVVGRTIVLIDDIVDTGQTQDFLTQHFLNRGAAQVLTAAMFFKPGRFRGQTPPQWAGYSIADAFIIGYGLDFDEEGRHLPQVYALAEDAAASA